jgi:hypothetical protein
MKSTRTILYKLHSNHVISVTYSTIFSVYLCIIFAKLLNAKEKSLLLVSIWGQMKRSIETESVRINIVLTGEVPVKLFL